MKVTKIKKTVKNKKRAASKVYEYTLKNISSLRFNDLMDIMGVDAACSMFNYFSGSYIYIPNKKTIKKDFLHAIIRNEASNDFDPQTPIAKIVRILSGKYSLTEITIYNILGIKNTDGMNKKLFEQKIKIDKIRDENLLSIVSVYWETLKRNGLL